jgi:hypothetical protein
MIEVEPRRSCWSSPDGVSLCAVNAGGVPAQWVEITEAWIGQMTFLCFEPQPHGWRSPPAAHTFATMLAMATGARVLTVGCRSQPSRQAVEDSVAAYAWLLEEGVDLRRTAFVDDPDGAGLTLAVLLAARNHRLPMPAVCFPQDITCGEWLTATRPRLVPLRSSDNSGIVRIVTWLQEDWRTP